MGRKRKKGKHLRQGIVYKHGAYYYRQRIKRDGKFIKEIWHWLGKSEVEGMQKFYRDFYDKNEPVLTMGDWFDWYIANVASKKAPDTYRNNLESIGNLRSFFDELLPADVDPVLVYKYRDVRGETSARGANKDKGTLSHLFTKLVEKGVVKTNPCLDVKGLPENKRTRRVTDDEFNAVKKTASPMMAAAMEFAYITALRQGDILKAKWDWVIDEGINIPIKKTGSRVLFRWTPELRECVERIRKIPRKIRGLYLFTTEEGKPYASSGFKSIWQRLNRRALKKGLIKERFRFHDIRRKRATDAEEKYGIEFARKLLAHETQEMTANYVRGSHAVNPQI